VLRDSFVIRISSFSEHPCNPWFFFSCRICGDNSVRKNRKNFCLQPVEQIKYKLVDVQPAKAEIVNTQKPDAPIEIGFAAPWKETL